MSRMQQSNLLLVYLMFVLSPVFSFKIHEFLCRSAMRKLCFFSSPALSDCSPLRCSNDYSDPVKGTVRLLEDVENAVEQAIAERFNSMNDAAETLSERPGYAFGLGCHKWRSCGYNGTIKSWNSPKLISWLSSSLMQLDPSSIDFALRLSKNDDDLGAPTLSIAMLNIALFSGSSIDVPHLKMSVEKVQESKSGNRSFRINTDYIPRVDIMANLAYYDKYFSHYDTNGIISQVKGLRMPASSSVLSRILTSPFAIDIELPKNDSNAQSVIQTFCLNHINQWLDWVDNDGSTVTSEKSVSDSIDINIVDISRDESIQQLLHKDHKFMLAVRFGADFAPLAEEIALAHRGPM